MACCKLCFAMDICSSGHNYFGFVYCLESEFIINVYQRKPCRIFDGFLCANISMVVFLDHDAGQKVARWGWTQSSLFCGISVYKAEARIICIKFAVFARLLRGTHYGSYISKDVHVIFGQSHTDTF